MVERGHGETVPRVREPRPRPLTHLDALAASKCLAATCEALSMSSRNAEMAASRQRPASSAPGEKEKKEWLGAVQSSTLKASAIKISV